MAIGPSSPRDRPSRLVAAAVVSLAIVAPNQTLRAPVNDSYTSGRNLRGYPDPHPKMHAESATFRDSHFGENTWSNCFCRNGCNAAFDAACRLFGG